MHVTPCGAQKAMYNEMDLRLPSDNEANTDSSREESSQPSRANATLPHVDTLAALDSPGPRRSGGGVPRSEAVDIVARHAPVLHPLKGAGISRTPAVPPHSLPPIGGVQERKECGDIA
jgi:hypothetical protein